MRKEILTIHKKQVSLNIAAGCVVSVRMKDIEKKGARAIKSGRLYSASFVGKIQDEVLLKSALANDDGALPCEYGLPMPIAVEKKVLLKSGGAQEFIQSTHQILEELSKTHPNFIFSGQAELSRIRREINYLDSVRQLVEYDECSCVIFYKHKKSAGIIDGYFGAHEVANLNIFSSIKGYADYLRAFDVEVPLRAGKIPVVFFNQDCLLKKVRESVRMDNYMKGIGLFCGRLGERVLSEKFTLNDVAYEPSLLAMSPFDDEGMVRKETCLKLFERGVFKNLISDSRNAAKYNKASTGNAQRNFDSAVRLDFNTLYFAPGERNIEEIFRDLPECLVVEVASGGDFTDTGDYSTPVQNGFLMKNGKIVGKVPQLTLKSSVQKMFGAGLMEVAKDSLSPLSANPSLVMEMDILLN